MTELKDLGTSSLFSLLAQDPAVGCLVTSVAEPFLPKSSTQQPPAEALPPFPLDEAGFYVGHGVDDQFH
jgi:hypothetical protein